MSLQLLGWMATLALAAGVAALSYLLARSRELPVPVGHRGRMRVKARADYAAFRALEPWLALIAAAVRRLPIKSLRARLERMIVRAGEYLGLSADELLVLSCVEALAVGCLTAAVACLLDAPPMQWALAGISLGAAAPFLRMRGHASAREVQMERGLPEAIDLLALCMSGGLDFAGSLNTVLAETSLRQRALQEDLQRVAEAMALGQSRSDALLGLAERCGARSVGDFVAAVVQAERTGTPLRVVFEIQARVLRMHRSTLAEEAAARAALLLLGPLCILLGMMLVLLFGPFMIGGIGL